MKVCFEAMSDFNAAASQLKAGTTVAIMATGEEFVVNAQSDAEKTSSSAVTFPVTTPDIPSTGFFIAPLNTGNTLTVSSTNTPITKFNQSSLLCTNPSTSGVGLMHAYVDTYGSTITPTEANLDATMQSVGYLDVSIALLGDAGPHYPYAGIAVDLSKTNAGAATATKATFDVSSYTGVKVTYQASTAIKLQLEGNADTDGANFFYSLPATSGSDSTVTVLWANFSQPGWVSGGQVRTIPKAALCSIKFQYDTMQSSCTFKLKSLSFTGTGPFISAPTDISSTYDEVTKKYIKSWFDKFYVESSDKKQGRIKWISGTNVDPEITVSEGIGYGMLVALMGVRSASANDPFKIKFDRMWAFYKANEDNKGLMNWKTSGFGTNGSAAGTVGSGSAPDADMDVAKALLLAFEKFKDPQYLADARSLMWRIWNYEIMYVSTSAGYKYLVAPGDSWTSYCNPSYAAKLPAMRLFAWYDDNVTHNWAQAYLDNVWQLQQNQAASVASGSYGLPSNWCGYNGEPVNGSSTMGYGWDACRVPLHLSECYRWFGCQDSYNYLKVIADNTTLAGIIKGVTPMDLQLTVSPTGVMAQHYNGTSWAAAGVDEYSSVALATILCAFTATGAVGPTLAAALVQIVINYLPDDEDYFRGVIKCFMLGEISQTSTRYAADPGGANALAHIINIAGPDNSPTQRAQIAFPLSGSAPQYRLYSNGSWTAFSSLGGGGGGTLAGDVSGSSGANTVDKIKGNAVPANAAGSLINNGTGTLSWGAPTVTLAGDVSGASGTTTVDKIKGNTVPANAAGALVNNGSGTLSWTALPTSVTMGGDVTGASGTATVSKIKGNTVPVNGVGALTNDGNGTLTWATQAVTLSGDVSGASGATTVNKLKGNTVPANGVGFLSNDGNGNLAWSPSGAGSGTLATLTAIADFGVNQRNVSVTFPDANAGALDACTVLLPFEDLIIQGVVGHKVSTSVGVSHTVMLYAPAGATGQYNIKLAVIRG
jgi:endo-1,4-beta-D-glucanase Y